MTKYAVELTNYYEVEAEDEQEALEMAEDIFYEDGNANYDDSIVTKVE